jgi:hypothetical protein
MRHKKKLLNKYSIYISRWHKSKVFISNKPREKKKVMQMSAATKVLFSYSIAQGMYDNEAPNPN